MGGTAFSPELIRKTELFTDFPFSKMTESQSFLFWEIQIRPTMKR